MEYSCSNRGDDGTESPQMRLFVQSEAESENFAKVSRVLHLAVNIGGTNYSNFITLESSPCGLDVPFIVAF